MVKTSDDMPAPLDMSRNGFLIGFLVVGARTRPSPTKCPRTVVAIRAFKQHRPIWRDREPATQRDAVPAAQMLKFRRLFSRHFVPPRAPYPTGQKSTPPTRWNG